MEMAANLDILKTVDGGGQSPSRDSAGWLADCLIKFYIVNYSYIF